MSDSRAVPNVLLDVEERVEALERLVLLIAEELNGLMLSSSQRLVDEIAELYEDIPDDPRN